MSNELLRHFFEQQGYTEEMIEVLLSFKTLGCIDNYTKIPEEYLGDNYDKWFSVDTIRDKYDGDVLKACEAHPVYHMYYLEGFKLRNYQVYAMDMMFKEKKLFLLWGRRLGKSVVFKGYDSWAMWWNKFPQGREKTTKCLALAHTQDGAESYVDEIRDMYECGDRRVESVFKGKLGKKYFSSKFPKKGDNAKINQTELNIWKNGWNSIAAFPPTTRARGRPASIINMDEVGFWEDYTPDEYKIYGDVIRPIITDQPNTKLFAATTPNGKRGLAYDLLPIDGHDSPFKLIWFPFWIRRDLNYIKEIKAVEDEYVSQGRLDAFRQEYLGELVNKTNAYFDSENEVDKVIDMAMETYSTYSGVCEAGIDFGGSKTSRTVITVSRFNQQLNRIERLYHKRYSVGKDSTLKEDILTVSRMFPNIHKWHLDSQGGGSGFYDWFRNTFSPSMLDEVVFRTRKADMFRLFKIACFKGRVKSYYDTDLTEEFLNFTADLKPAKGFTDDLLDSFVLSSLTWLEEKKKPVFKVIKY